MSNHCKKIVHFENDCFRKSRNDKKKSETSKNERNLEVLMASEAKDYKSITLIGNTGSTSHMTNYDKGMFVIKPNNQQIMI
jgi:hypothetical protein